jgi:hypothetical protein
MPATRAADAEPGAFRLSVTASVEPYQAAILRYYGHRKLRSNAEVLRLMIRLFAMADTEFCPERYKAYAKEILAPALADRPERVEYMCEQVERFVSMVKEAKQRRQ